MHILIADDHAGVRRGLREILADVLPGADFSEAGNGDEVLSRLGKSQISMLVLDINMPGRSGMDVLRDVQHTFPRLPVIILSCQPEEQYAVRCLRAGAAACQGRSKTRPLDRIKSRPVNAMSGCWVCGVEGPLRHG